MGDFKINRGLARAFPIQQKAVAKREMDPSENELEPASRPCEKTGD
jgi:hypothetical protein